MRTFFIMNEEAGERLLALVYAKKVLRIASRAKDKVQLARACNNIAVAYNKLHQVDSANILHYKKYGNVEIHTAKGTNIHPQ